MFTVDRVFRAALFNTVYFTAVNVPLSVVLGLATAILVNQALRGVRDLQVHLPAALCHGDRGALAGLEMALPAGYRVDQLRARRGRHRRSGVAHQPDLGHACPHLDERLEGFGYNMVIFLAGLQVFRITSTTRPRSTARRPGAGF